MKKLTTNRKYKDSVFRMLFKGKAELLSLYNAVNGTHYENAEDLEINTLDEGVYIKMKNDVSFVFGFELNLYEHQSTKCGNIPLRYLFYVSDLLAGIVSGEDIYSTRMIKIPTPRFVVFYNGTDFVEDVTTYKLSEQFEKNTENPELELTVKMYNINENHSFELMSACRMLKDYAAFVGKIRKYVSVMTIEDAVKIAISECIEENILRDFLVKNRAEVENVSVLEYNEELHLKNVHQDGYDEGHTDGYDEAKKESDAIIAEKDAELEKQRARIAELEAMLSAGRNK